MITPSACASPRFEVPGRPRPAAARFPRRRRTRPGCPARRNPARILRRQAPAAVLARRVSLFLQRQQETQHRGVGQVHRARQVRQRGPAVAAEGRRIARHLWIDLLFFIRSFSDLYVHRVNYIHKRCRRQDPRPGKETNMKRIALALMAGWRWPLVPSARRRLARPARQMDRAVPAGRLDRHAGPAGQPQTRRAAEADRDRREQGRRRRQPGTDYAVKQPADGYTIVMGNIGPISINPAVSRPAVQAPA